MVPWKEGKPMSWDVTVISPLADSYVMAQPWNAGSAAEQTDRKVVKYSALDRTHYFPVTHNNASD